MILHLSGDFPDTIEPFKTPVIKALVNQTQGEFEHEVISLNRTSPALKTLIKQFLVNGGKPKVDTREQPFDSGAAIEYFAPSKGLYHATLLRQLGDMLAKRYESSKKPDLIVGHKLTIEGIAVRRMAQKLKLPYAISIQGDTDTRILSLRPDLRPELSRVFHDAAMVFPFAPWAMRSVESKLGPRAGSSILLPCPTDLDEPLAPRVGASAELISVFHLKNYRRKNLAGLVRAMRRLAVVAPDIKLSVIGGGSAAELARCKNLLRNLGNVTLDGPLGHAELRIRLNSAAGFVMPSLRESFGLVFIEALFSGLPIIYPEGRSVDGFFENDSFALKVDPNSSKAIADAILKLVENESEAKQALAEWQRDDRSRRFVRSTIAAEFARGLHLACGNSDIFDAAPPVAAT